MTSSKILCALVVDDHPLLQRIHSSFLKKAGFETTVVGNGKEAVDLYRGGASFHLVLMDMEMPIMDGPTATKELRSMGVDSMIVGVSSCDGESEKRAFIAAGLDDFRAKPLTHEALTPIIEKVNKTHN